MKKVILAASVIGLVAVPSFVMAQQDADDGSSSSSLRQDDTPSTDDNSQSAAVPAQNGSVPVEAEVALPENNISLEAALAVAQNAMPGKTVEKVEIELEHGVVVYSVRFTDKSRVDVDAVTGQIMRTRTDGDNRNVRADDKGRGRGGDDHRQDDNRGRGHDHHEDKSHGRGHEKYDD